MLRVIMEGPPKKAPFNPSRENKEGSPWMLRQEGLTFKGREKLELT